MTAWTPEQTAAAQAASGAEWRQRAAAILGNHNAVTDRDDSILCKLCGVSIYNHDDDGTAEPDPNSPYHWNWPISGDPISPEEEETLPGF